MRRRHLGKLQGLRLNVSTLTPSSLHSLNPCVLRPTTPLPVHMRRLRNISTSHLHSVVLSPVDESLRTMRLMCIEVHYITFPCWQKPVHRFCGVVAHFIPHLGPTTSQRYLLSSNVIVVRHLLCHIETLV